MLNPKFPYFKYVINNVHKKLATITSSTLNS
jgi:hypothetical protein